MPEPSFADKVIKFLGKKRGIIIPNKAIEKFGHHVYVKAYKESFWKSLLRPGYQELPEDMVDLFSFQDLKDEALKDFKR